MKLWRAHGLLRRSALIAGTVAASNALGPDSTGFQPSCATVGPIIGNV
jgi:hypothetical protein